VGNTCVLSKGKGGRERIKKRPEEPSGAREGGGNVQNLEQIEKKKVSMRAPHPDNGGKSGGKGGKRFCFLGIYHRGKKNPTRGRETTIRGVGGLLEKGGDMLGVGSVVGEKKTRSVWRHRKENSGRVNALRLK